MTRAVFGWQSERYRTLLRMRGIKIGFAYKVSMLNSQKIPSMRRWFLATFGAAKALQLDSKIGNFTKGKEADFIIIDADASPFLKYRREYH